MVLAGRAWSLTLLPSTAPWNAEAVQLSAQWEGCQWQAAVTPIGLETLLKPWLGPVGLQDLGPSLLLAMLQDLADQALSHGRGGLEGMRLELGPQESTSPKVEWSMRLVPVDDPADAEGVAVLLRCDTAVIRWLMARLGNGSGPRHDLRRWGGLPLRASVEFGWVDLSLSDLRSLRPQDVVLPDVCWRNGAQREALVRIAPRFGVRVRCDDEGQLHALSGVETMEHEPMGEPTPPDNMAQAEVDPRLSGIALRLSFDLGHLETTLRDLSGITAGHVFNLGLPTQSAVQLRINGWHVGEGEIVEIGDRLGIAVTRFAPPNA